MILESHSGVDSNIRTPEILVLIHKAGHAHGDIVVKGFSHLSDHFLVIFTFLTNDSHLHLSQLDVEVITERFLYFFFHVALQ
jgi:hypothetical protein